MTTKKILKSKMTFLASLSIRNQTNYTIIGEKLKFSISYGTIFIFFTDIGPTTVFTTFFEVKGAGLCFVEDVKYYLFFS